MSRRIEETVEWKGTYCLYLMLNAYIETVLGEDSVQALPRMSIRVKVKVKFTLE